MTTSRATATEPAPKRYALLVAVTTYVHAVMNEPQPLAFPEADARAVGDFLLRHGHDVTLLLGGDATQRAIVEALDGLASRGNQQGAVVFGLWGHGIEFAGSDESMFCPFDTGIRRATAADGVEARGRDGTPLIEPDPATLVSMREVLGAVRTSAAGNRLLVADCCGNDPLAARGRAFGIGTKVYDLPGNPAAFFSCSATEKSFEHTDWGHGAFTKCPLDLLPELVTKTETT